MTERKDNVKTVGTEFTDQQKSVIGYGAGDLIVSASAGSGKTTVMLERVIKLIGEGHSLKNMLISTFTVSAAEDMRAKLAKNLRRKYAETGDERFRKESEELASADICTLHKWCQKLIKKYFYVIGADPAFEIADDGESAAWLNESVEAALAEQDETDADFADLCACYIRKRSDSDIKRAIVGMLAFAFTQRDDKEWLEKAADCYDDDGACRAFTEKTLRKLCVSAQNAVTDYERAAANAGITEEAEPYIKEMYAKFDGDESAWTRASRKVTAIKAERDEAKKRIEKYIGYTQYLNEARNDIAGRTAKKLCAIALRALELYKQKKTEKGKLDFSDLERRAKEILESEEGDGIRASLDYVFIDEYQDISNLQESIISLLGKNNLFFVGDIKQNIYAFRDCTPKAFANRYGELRENGKALELNKNFRSKKGILSFCNLLFSRIMTREFGMVDYASDGRFDIGNADNDAAESRSDDGSVEIFRYKAQDKDERTVGFDEVYSVREDAPKDEDGSDAESDAITRYIVRLISEENYKYEDIAVLTRSRNKGEEKVAQNLRALGIPVSVGSKMSVIEGRVNRLLISMLRLADNFYDDISLTAVMRSPVGGFDDSELTRIRAAYADFKYFYECVIAYAKRPEGGKVAAFLEKISEYARLSRIVSVGELAGRMTSENKLFATALGERSGMAKADALGRLLEAASGFGGSLSEFLAQLSSESAPVAEVPQQSGSVRIMTVHASKGLEFPVVVLCGITRGKKRNDDIALFDSELGIGVEARVKETGEKLPSVPLIAIKEKKRRENKEEEMRILYVALTRAKERLALFLPDDMRSSDKPPEECDSFADWIYPAAVAHGIKDIEDARRSFTAEPETFSAADEKGTEILRQYLKDAPCADTHDIKKSVTGLIAEIVPSEDTALNTVSLTGAEYEGADARSAMRRGTAYHTALERADFTRSYEEQKGTLSALPDFGLVDVGKLEAAIKAIGRETSGASLYREQPFVFASDRSVNGECDGMILQGVIDLMAVRGDECEIIDYKTGRLDGERAAKYGKQLDIYAAAVEKLLGLNVKKKRIYLIDEKRFAD